jgi:acyl-CoA dehydrogenase
MIDFELSPNIQSSRQMIHMVAEQLMRPISREYDEREHEKPTEFLETMWKVSAGTSFGNDKDAEKAPGASPGPKESNLASCINIEELSWGDAGLYLTIPNAGLGGAAVLAAGTPERSSASWRRSKRRAPRRHGDHRAALRLGRAASRPPRRDGDQWVLNGTKIYCTSGLMAVKSDGFIVSGRRSTRPPAAPASIVRGARHARDEGHQGREQRPASAPPTPR